jgi:hypothetical protein
VRVIFELFFTSLVPLLICLARNVQRPPQQLNLWSGGSRRIAMILKSVGVVSVGKVLGCLYALLGLIVGAVISLLAMAGLAVGRPPQNQPQGVAAIIMGVGAIIVLPIFYGLVGFIGGIISAALYNLVASVVGGIELELRSDANDDWEEGDREPN